MHTQDATDDEVRHLRHAISVLDAFLPAVQAFVHDCWLYSPTEIQRGAVYENGMVQAAFTWTGTYIHMAADHLIALRQILAGGLLPSSACYTLIRGCAEAAVRASWLADPEIERTQRVKRAVAQRLAIVEAKHKVDRDDPAYDKSGYSQHVDRIIKEAAANKIPLKQPKTPEDPEQPKTPEDPPRLDIERFPNMTPLMDQQLRRLVGQTQPHSWYYALLSSYAHSSPFTVLIGATLSAADEHDLFGVDVSPNVPQILKSTDPAAALLAQTTRDFGLMVGRNDAPLLPALVTID